MMLITIVTPTIGSKFLKKLLQSIHQQEGLNRDFQIEHFIVVDHAEVHRTQVNTILNEVLPQHGVKRYIFDIPFSSGANQYKGHRIYSAIPQFANGEYVILLDDDNFLYENHIANFVKVVREKEYDWVYSLRSIVDKNDKFLCKDQCESLGYLSPVFYNPQSYLIDTNCYFVKSTIIKQSCHIWNRVAQYNDNDPDRQFGRILMSQFPNFGCTKEYTLGYRVEEDGKGVSVELFRRGNREIYQKYGSLDVWSRPTLFLAHFNDTQTERMIARIYGKKSEEESIAFKQWQLNLFDEMGDEVHIVNAYRAPFVPKNSMVWVHMCHFEELPHHLLKRTDLYRVLYTIESPNIRHQKQWDASFLQNYFDIVMTYWTDLFKVRSENTIYFPFIHRLSMKSSADLRLITNDVKEVSACILLENRDFRGKYMINQVELEAQDYKRRIVAENLAKHIKVYCYGDSWKSMETKSPNILCRSTPSRFLDSDKTIDYYRKHYFSIIIENCNASGYVSEKIYDAWMVSSIPIYCGNFNETLRKFIGEDIPIEKMMIDLNKVGIEKIGDYLSELYQDDIDELFFHIDKYKKIVLERVGVGRYNQEVKKMIQTIYSS